MCSSRFVSLSYHSKVKASHCMGNGVSVIPLTKGCQRLTLLAAMVSVVAAVWGIGLYSLSSSAKRVLLAYKGFLESTRISFSFIWLWAASTSIFLFSCEFYYFNASISMTLLFLNSMNSRCILACPSRIATKLTWDGPPSFAPTILLRVETI